MRDIPTLLTQLTLKEKASLCSGQDFWTLKAVERLDIPSITVTDGPHGLRKQTGDNDHIGLNESVPATCFPTASALASTWNRELIYDVGVALGEECRQEKVGVILGPGANIKRSPLCGRNFEYFSEDPYLSGEIAKSHINGVQSQGIGTSLKHFVANNQESRRMTIDTIVDERTLREIYLAGFEIAVKEAQPWTVMCAYNRLNGIYCSEHPRLLTQILKEEWGHTGLVITDWGANNERVDGLAAGQELEMPASNGINDAKIVAAVEDGTLDEAVLDRAVERLLTMTLQAAETLATDFEYDRDAHHKLARQAASEGAVLLKNEANLLPIDPAAKIAILGEFAKTPRYQGNGSSLMNPWRIDNIYDEITHLTEEQDIAYAAGYQTKGDAVDHALIREACASVEDADVVLIFAGLPDIYEAEGLDRTHMQMPASHNALIEEVAKINPNVVVILSNGSPVEMPWIDNVPAILDGYLGGQAGAGAISDILFGRTNPSGKLAETFPLRLEDNPSHGNFPGAQKTVEYREGIYVGYRYFDSADQDVLFPFGHGLSYTTFDYSNLRLSSQQINEHDPLTVTVTIKNSGPRTGQEIVQLYVRDIESTLFRPAQELKGFAKVLLNPGEEQTISIELDRRAFAYFDTDANDWCVEAGEFEIRVGASSRDIRLTQSVQIQSDHRPTMDQAQIDKLQPYYQPGQPFTQSAFEALYGQPMPPSQRTKDEPYTINTPLVDMQQSFIGRRLYATMQKQAKSMIKDEDGESAMALLMENILKEAPLRLILMMGGGAFTPAMVDALLMMMNGRFFKGGTALIRAIRNK